MNSKAQVPTLLTFLIAIVFAVMTLSAFLMFSGDFNNKSAEFASIVSNAAFNQQYIIEQAKLIAKETITSSSTNVKQKFQQLADERNFHFSEAGNFFGKIRNEKFDFAEQNNIYTLEINRLFVQSENSAGKIKRNFDICMIFDNKGNFLNNC